MGEEQLYRLAAAAEASSEHPLGKAVVRGFQQLYGTALPRAEQFHMIVGSGVTACIEGKKVCAGNESLMEAAGTVLSKEAKDRAEEYIAQGSTIIYVAVDSVFVGFLALTDTVRRESAVMMQDLTRLGVQPVLLTGDHGKITSWRSQQAHARTAARRPDLYKDWCLRHPLRPRRWKRSERAELVRTDAALDAAAQVYAASWQEMCAEICTPEYVAQHTPEHMRAKLQADKAKGWAFYLHSTSGTPDAIIGVCHKTGEIGRLYVHPRAQGQGIGAMMLEFARKKLAEHETPHLFVLDANLPAMALYLRMGYRFDSVAKVYDPAVEPAAVQFCRELKFVYTPTKTEG